jgi:nucleoside-diphosphate-sugar epimerase
VTGPLTILGCGYVGTRLAKAALAAGRTVKVCGRSTGRLAPLQELGAIVKYLDAGIVKQLAPICSGTAGGTVVFSIPPVTLLPPGQVMRAALQAAYGAGADCFIYFSSSGLYGEDPDDDVWIDEDTPLAADPAMKDIATNEETIAQTTFDRLRCVTLRLAPVYGPGRGVRSRLQKGDYRLLDDGRHAISRIHVDDVVNVVFAAEDKAENQSTFLLADDEPTTQLDYAKWLCERMKLPLPASRSQFEPGKPRTAHRNRKIRNTKIKEQLGVTLRYPTFREGEAAIEAELA